MIYVIWLLVERTKMPKGKKTKAEWFATRDDAEKNGKGFGLIKKTPKPTTRISGHKVAVNNEAKTLMRVAIDESEFDDLVADLKTEHDKKGLSGTNEVGYIVETIKSDIADSIVKGKGKKSHLVISIVTGYREFGLQTDASQLERDDLEMYSSRRDAIQFTLDNPGDWSE